MSNVLTGDMKYIDTFSSDVTLSSNKIKLVYVAFKSTGVNDKLVLEDSKGILHVPQIQILTANDLVEIFPGADGIWMDGLVLDVSDGTYAGTCQAWIRFE